MGLAYSLRFEDSVFKTAEETLNGRLQREYLTWTCKSFHFHQYFRKLTAAVAYLSAAKSRSGLVNDPLAYNDCWKFSALVFSIIELLVTKAIGRIPITKTMIHGVDIAVASSKVLKRIIMA